MAKGSTKNTEKVIPLREEAPVRRRERPGYLAGAPTLTIHTLEANNLLFGKVLIRKKRSSVGLISFSNAYISIQRSDYRRRVGQVIEDVRERFKLLRNQIEEHKQRQIFKIENYQSNKPRDITLKPLSGTVLRVAYLLVQYDQLVLEIHQLHDTGVYDLEQRNQMLRQATGYMKKVLESPFWVRDDVMAATSSNHDSPKSADESNHAAQLSKNKK